MAHAFLVRHGVGFLRVVVAQVVLTACECRGVGVAGQPFTVFRTTDGETLDVRYYSAKQAGVYTLKQKVGQETTIVLNF